MLCGQKAACEGGARDWSSGVWWTGQVGMDVEERAGGGGGRWVGRDRKSVVEGKSVGLGGRRSMKKKKRVEA